MVNGRTKKKGIIRVLIIIVALLAIAGFAVWYWIRSAVPTIEGEVLRKMAGLYGEGELNISEMDIYNDNEDDMCYCRVKYSFYFVHDKEWYDVEEVWYGTTDHVEGCFSLSDLSMEEYSREARSAFERVRKTAKCRVLSQEEIKEGLRVAYDQIAKENAEFDAEQEDSKK